MSAAAVITPTEGIAASIARGIHTDRPPIDPATMRQLRDKEKLGASVIAKRLGIGHAAVYRLLGKLAA
jgi:DNA-binding transcriptional regulator YiaG